uniref:Anaphase-promoting complex subunit 4 WD40 domain-containing protein n=1 Tax=Dunaliella tertiolecta TaxID=3047 RepID=A0A7S3VNJ3_DUNTE
MDTYVSYQADDAKKALQFLTISADGCTNTICVASCIYARTPAYLRQVDDAQKALQFVTISSDGCVNIWTLNKSELTHEFLMKLRKEGSGLGKEGGAENKDTATAEEEAAAAGMGGMAGGCCMDFNKGAGQEHIYLVGTEEGSIHKCSKAYSSQYLSSYQAHSLAVYSVKWNCIHHKTFLSASADWLVKLWDANQPRKPILTFDFKDAVGDIAWAPYSATVFAAVTDDGKVHVYDLYEDKLMPMCAQKVVKKAKLTKIVFNPKWPIILVGDDKGVVTSLKLSPNLRKQPKIQPGQKETLEQLEWAKLDHVIDVACRSDPEAMKEQAAAAAKAS